MIQIVRRVQPAAAGPSCKFTHDRKMHPTVDILQHENLCFLAEFELGPSMIWITPHWPACKDHVAVKRKESTSVQRH